MSRDVNVTTGKRVGEIRKDSFYMKMLKKHQALKNTVTVLLT